MTKILVCSDRDWTLSLSFTKDFDEQQDITVLNGSSAPEVDFLEEHAFDYVFFLFWSGYIPAEIFEKFETIVFHMTDLPYGRGGSPLQNLILRGHQETSISAIRCTSEVDAGGVYLKKPLNLSGSAHEIYLRSVPLIASMIEHIVTNNIAPIPQAGEVTRFTRRHPGESEIGEVGSSKQMFDFIRMLDAPGYPRAYLKHLGFRLEFFDARIHEGDVVASVRFIKLES
jgi:methionyl-tRNA formyltransferase